MSDERPRPGLSTRAIRAAGRVLPVDQTPTSMPIHQTATFATEDAAELAAVSMGSVHTMVVHPPATSHRSLSNEQLARAGITPGLLRVSVGLKDEADLIADFAAGLAAANRAG